MKPMSKELFDKIHNKDSYSYGNHLVDHLYQEFLALPPVFTVNGVTYQNINNVIKVCTPENYKVFDNEYNFESFKEYVLLSFKYLNKDTISIGELSSDADVLLTHDQLTDFKSKLRLNQDEYIITAINNNKLTIKKL